MTTHLTTDELTLVYFEECETKHRDHLAVCDPCRAEYGRLALFLDAMRAVPLPVQPPAWEQRLWANIAPRVRTTLERGSGSRFRLWMMVPVLSGLLAFAFLAGMYTQHRAQDRFTRDATQSFSPEARKRVLLIALGDHLDRSQLVLAELVNAPEGQPADISEERQLAGRLIGENRLLRLSAAHSGDNADAAVLDQLERVLVAIAHSPAEISPEDLADLQQRIEAPGLLFKVRVVGNNARNNARENAPGNARENIREDSREKGTKL